MKRALLVVAAVGGLAVLMVLQLQSRHPRGHAPGDSGRQAAGSTPSGDPVLELSAPQGRFPIAALPPTLPATADSERVSDAASIIGETEARHYALLHETSSDQDLKETLAEIRGRVPRTAVTAAHRSAVERGDFEVVRAASDLDPGQMVSFDSTAMNANIPFVSVLKLRSDGSAVRTRVEPIAIAGYSQDVSHAVWIHFEQLRRREESRRARAAPPQR